MTPSEKILRERIADLAAGRVTLWGVEHHAVQEWARETLKLADAARETQPKMMRPGRNDENPAFGVYHEKIHEWSPSCEAMFPRCLPVRIPSPPPETSESGRREMNADPRGEIANLRSERDQWNAIAQSFRKERDESMQQAAKDRAAVERIEGLLRNKPYWRCHIDAADLRRALAPSPEGKGKE